MNISKQVAIVSGANRGLGKELALELLARGTKVYAGARNPESIDLPGLFHCNSILRIHNLSWLQQR